MPPQVLNQTFHILGEIVPVFLFAVLVSSVLDQFLPENYVENFFKNYNLSALFSASLIGALLPMCTCGMIPLVIKLMKRGMDWRVLTAFLVAGNACSIPALWLTIVMGYDVVLVRLLASVAYGVLVALALAALTPQNFKLELKIYQGDEQTHESKFSCCDEAHHESKIKVSNVLHDFMTMCKSFLPWIIIAALIAAIFDVYMMQGALQLVQQANPWIAALVAFPFYFCAGADVPISKELLAAGLPLGTVISFMLASPGINLTSYLVYQKLLGIRNTAYFTGASYLIAVIIGLVLNYNR